MKRIEKHNSRLRECTDSNSSVIECDILPFLLPFLFSFPRLYYVHFILYHDDGVSFFSAILVHEELRTVFNQAEGIADKTASVFEGGSSNSNISSTHFAVVGMSQLHD